MHNLNFIIYYSKVVEKIKDKKGDFVLILVGCVHKLMARHCIRAACICIPWQSCDRMVNDCHMPEPQLFNQRKRQRPEQRLS